MSKSFSEADRQQAGDEYRFLESLPDPVYDDIAKLACLACGTPVALVSLLDRERQWFKAHAGTDLRETQRNIAFCEHAIRQPGQLLEVKDARADARFADNPLVTGGPGIRFYAGMPMVTDAGLPIGTVCVWDEQPRALQPEQRAALESLARLAMHMLDTHRREQGLRRQLLLQTERAAPATSTVPVAASEPGFALALIELQRYTDAIAAKGERHTERLLAEVELAVDEIARRQCGGNASRVSGSHEIIVLLPGDQTDDAVHVIEAHLDAVAGASGLTFLLASAVSEPGQTRPEEVYLKADHALGRLKDQRYGTWAG